MKNIILYILCLLLSLILIGCGNVTNNEDSNYRYPLKVGNSWTYKRKTTFIEYGTSTDNVSVVTENVFFDDLFVEIIGTRDIDGIETFIVEESLTENYVSYNKTFNSCSYLVNEESGLYKLAYEGNSVAINSVGNEKQENNFNGIFVQKSGVVSNLVGISAVTSYNFTTTNRRVLQYPLNVGSRWVEYESYEPFVGTIGIHIKVEKEYIGNEIIENNSGINECMVIKQYGMFFDDAEFKDYINAKGLVKKLSVHRNIAYYDELPSFNYMDEDFRPTPHYMDLVIEYDLVDTNAEQ